MTIPHPQKHHQLPHRHAHRAGRHPNGDANQNREEHKRNSPLDTDHETMHQAVMMVDVSGTTVCLTRLDVDVGGKLARDTVMMHVVVMVLGSAAKELHTFPAANLDFCGGGLRG